MKARLVALFLTLLLLPLGLALWLGIRSVQDGQASAQTQARTVWSGPLADLRSRVEAFVQSVEEALRSGSDDPLVKTRFVVRDGTVVEPPAVPCRREPDPFFDRTSGLWDQRFWDRAASEGALAPTAGWKTWSATDGPGFVFWFRDERDSRVVRGVEVDTWAFLSRLSAVLPDLQWSRAEGAVRALLLRDSGGQTFARWGRWEPADTGALLSLPLGAPFEGWEFRLYLAPEPWEIRVCSGPSCLFWSGSASSASWASERGVFVRALRASLEDAGQRVRFVNQVSHELKTPLTNILLYGELLEGALADRPDPKVKDYLEVIRGESGRLGRLITNVLTFARKDHPDAPRPRPLVWDEVVDAALKPFRPGLADRGLALVRLPEAANTAGEWDPDWVGQILGNLLSNAEKYAADGKSVEVATGASAAEVWVRVADRGPGIPPGAAERVFQPFARLDDRLTAGASGTGLGLGIARDLARRHGGSLVLEPSPSGASFLLTLPRVSGSVRMTLLVAEDDPMTRRALAEILSAEGWTVVTAADGTRAWGTVPTPGASTWSAWTS